MSTEPLFVPPGLPRELVAFLTALHDEVRQNLRQFAGDPNRAAGHNAKGDIQRAFDLETDRLVRRRLAAFFPAGILTTEEGNDEQFGSGPPLVRLVVDPVDGSDNWRLGLAYSALCISAFPPDGPLDLARQQWAFVGDISSNRRVGPAVRRTAPAHPTDDGGGLALADANWFHPKLAVFAARHHGAWRGAERLSTSGQSRLADATISIQLSRSPKQPQLLELFAAAKSVRSYGSSAHDVGLVASGQLDAHVDVRSRLTPESFLAACLAVEEAGGCIIGPDGARLPRYERLTDRASLIVAATPQLAEEIRSLLAGAVTQDRHTEAGSP